MHNNNINACKSCRDVSWDPRHKNWLDVGWDTQLGNWLTYGIVDGLVRWGECRGHMYGSVVVDSLSVHTVLFGHVRHLFRVCARWKDIRLVKRLGSVMGMIQLHVTVLLDDLGNVMYRLFVLDNHPTEQSCRHRS